MNHITLTPTQPIILDQIVLRVQILPLIHYSKSTGPPHISSTPQPMDSILNTNHIPNIVHNQSLTLPPPTWYNPYPKNNMVSAHRPRHTHNNTYHLINNWKHHSITNSLPLHNETPHFSPILVEPITPAMPNLFTTSKFTFMQYLKIYMRKPKTLQFSGYYFIDTLNLLKCGDIELNPGPMLDILRTHPTTHKQRANTYFIPNTIKLQPEYQHLAKTFAPILKHTHPLHPQATTTYPHLHHYTQIQNQSPPPHMLYALIITIHPSIDTCNNILAQPQHYHFNNIWTSTLIIRLASLTNPPERHILTPHPYTTLIENNQNIILPQNSIHTNIYEFIHNQVPTPTSITLKKNSLSSPTS